jgi:hypothetical protein
MATLSDHIWAFTSVLTGNGVSRVRQAAAS